MIILEKTETYGWEAAVRGMRNPMNSWDKTDSEWCTNASDNMPCVNCYYFEKGLPTCRCPKDKAVYVIGDNDLALMKKLAAAGNDHGKFLRMITVTVDITAPLYWWKEFDTYKVGTVANSCSTMHKIQAKEFTLDDFSHEHLWSTARMQLEATIKVLNNFRDAFNHPGAERDYKKHCWWQMIQLLPTSYNQKRTVQLNYAVLRNIYHSRKNHKLDEWHDFCHWIEGLPYSELITM